MPRKQKRTISGQPAQPLGAVPGQMYGMGVEQQRLQEAMPAPAIQPDEGGRPVGGGERAPTGTAAVSAGYNGAIAGRAGTAPPEVDDQRRGSREEQYAAAMAAAAQLRGAAGILTRPTDRPDVPVTNGISSGPGAGPEVLGMRRGTPTGRRLRELSALTGDPIFQQLAERARL